MNGFEHHEKGQPWSADRLVRHLQIIRLLFVIPSRELDEAEHNLVLGREPIFFRVSAADPAIFVETIMTRIFLVLLLYEIFRGVKPLIEKGSSLRVLLVSIRVSSLDLPLEPEFHVICVHFNVFLEVNRRRSQIHVAVLFEPCLLKFLILQFDVEGTDVVVWCPIK